jgi:hypothetical protein
MSLQHFLRATLSVRWPPAALALAARGEAQEGERLGGVASRRLAGFGGGNTLKPWPIYPRNI